MIYDIIIYDDICNDISFDIKNLTQGGLFQVLLKNSQKRGRSKLYKNWRVVTTGYNRLWLR